MAKTLYHPYWYAVLLHSLFYSKNIFLYLKIVVESWKEIKSLLEISCIDNKSIKQDIGIPIIHLQHIIHLSRHIYSLHIQHLLPLFVSLKAITSVNFCTDRSTEIRFSLHTSLHSKAPN